MIYASGVKPFSIHPTILNLTLVTPPSITNIAKGAVDIIVPSSQPMTVREWDLLEEAVNALDGSWGETEVKQGGGKIVICMSLFTSRRSKRISLPRVRYPSPREDRVTSRTRGLMSLAGILPPPLTHPSSVLAKEDLYELHLERIAQLSLHANVYLKILPPVVEKRLEAWYDDPKELDRVIKMYCRSSLFSRTRNRSPHPTPHLSSSGIQL